MLRKCPYCHQEMEKDCYLKDQGTVLSDFIVIEKDENYYNLSVDRLKQEKMKKRLF